MRFARGAIIQLSLRASVALPFCKIAGMRGDAPQANGNRKARKTREWSAARPGAKPEAMLLRPVFACFACFAVSLPVAASNPKPTRQRSSANLGSVAAKVRAT
jgi:hypothetical protein